MSESRLTRRTKRLVFTTGEITRLLWETLTCCFTRPFYFHRVIEQVINLGINSLPIAIVIGLAMGLVMTLQFGYGLAKFGGTLYVPAIVSLSLARELAPIFTSLLVAGRIGSGITAEIGSMNTTQQIDAIRALGTSPVRVLVVPRVVAAFVTLPLLTILSCFLGILGAVFIANLEFSMPPGFFLVKVLDTIRLGDVFSGLAKTLIFSLIITIVACYRGFRTRDGTRGVGNSTTWVVVTSSILILISDFFLSKFLIVYFLD